MSQTRIRRIGPYLSLLRGRRYRDPAHAVLLDSPGDEARRLDVLDELPQVGRHLFAALRRADRLLHARDLAFEHARPGQLFRVRNELRLEPAQGLELLADESLVRLGNSRNPDQLRVLQRAREIEVVGALVGDRDA